MRAVELEVDSDDNVERHILVPCGGALRLQQWLNFHFTPHLEVFENKRTDVETKKIKSYT